MAASGAVFTRQFQEGDLAVDKIDDNILNCPSNGVVFGEWSSSKGMNNESIATLKD